MKRALALTIIGMLYLVSANGEERGQSAPLQVSLGSDGIKRITGAEFITFVQYRTKQPITVDRSFWDVVLKKLESTKAPTKERAAPFLRKNFSAFLDDYQAYLLRDAKPNEQLKFTQETLNPYLNSVAKSCTGSPCKTPPCCGADGIECDPCG